MTDRQAQALLTATSALLEDIAAALQLLGRIRENPRRTRSEGDFGEAG